MESAQAQPERRCAPRRRVSLPVRFPGGTGVTCDLSATGVYFLSESSFEEGQQVILTIALQHAGPAGPLDVTCSGRVVRAEGPEVGNGARAVRGVAVASDTDGFGVAAMPVSGVSILPMSQGDAQEGHLTKSRFLTIDRDSTESSQEMRAL